MLVLLRISIGWHFLYAGIEKLSTPDFTADGFLAQAKGPLAGDFHKLVPDFEGSLRLSPDFQRDALRNELARAQQHYGFSTQQNEAAQQKLSARQVELDRWFAANGAGLTDLERDWRRLNLARDTAGQHPEPFGEKRLWEKQTELRGKVGTWTAELSDIQAGFAGDLQGLLTESQAAKGDIPESLQERLNLSRVVTYTNLAIGLCLIVGLFTRLAALGGAIFLASIVAAAPDLPWIFPAPHPSAGRSLIVNKEFIEMMALFTLATTRVGRWGGLDFFIHYLLVRPVYRRREKAS